MFCFGSSAVCSEYKNHSTGLILIWEIFTITASKDTKKINKEALWAKLKQQIIIDYITMKFYNKCNYDLFCFQK